ncbi:MAG: cell wall hydrolase [Ruminococcus flavefaciens]|nr:cell wall hydrolase [Ruminococcus flavefaciens]
MQSTEVPTVTAAAIQTKTAAPKPTKEPTPYYNMRFSKSDSYLLAKIAMAEAEGEPLKGKELVIMVVLNRMMDDEFPDTVHGVIYQERQFSPIDDGRFDRVEPDKDCWKALENVKALETDISDGALYFESCDYDNWHSQNLTFLYKYGNHKFYK